MSLFKNLFSRFLTSTKHKGAVSPLDRFDLFGKDRNFAELREKGSRRSVSLVSENFNAKGNEPRLIALYLPKEPRWSDGSEVTSTDITDIKVFLKYLSSKTKIQISLLSE